MSIKDNFKIEEMEVGEDEWVVTNRCYGSRQARWSFDNEEDAQFFIDSWIDITLDDKDPYKVGTEWWYFNSYEGNIIKVEIIDIELVVIYVKESLTVLMKKCGVFLKNLRKRTRFLS